MTSLSRLLTASRSLQTLSTILYVFLMFRSEGVAFYSLFFFFSSCADKRLCKVRQGEFVMLRGPSGGGKTTTLNIIGTIDRATEGTVEILGTVIDSKCKDSFLSRMWNVEHCSSRSHSSLFEQKRGWKRLGLCSRLSTCWQPCLRSRMWSCQ